MRQLKIEGFALEHLIERYLSSKSMRDIGKQYGLNHETYRRIKNGKSASMDNFLQVILALSDYSSAPPEDIFKQLIFISIDD